MSGSTFARRTPPGKCFTCESCDSSSTSASAGAGAGAGREGDFWASPAVGAGLTLTPVVVALTLTPVVVVACCGGAGGWAAATSPGGIGFCLADVTFFLFRLAAAAGFLEVARGLSVLLRLHFPRRLHFHLRLHFLLLCRHRPHCR